jgi:hypothetical protein
MVQNVELRKPACLADPDKLLIFNRLAETKLAFMPHEVSTTIGCSLIEAMQLLLLLYDRGHAEPFLLVYHKDHLDGPVTARRLIDGFPDLPFNCELCDQEIDTRESLLFDFLFKLKSQINIEYIHNGND